jgi:hypothetical protein
MREAADQVEADLRAQGGTGAGSVAPRVRPGV